MTKRDIVSNVFHNKPAERVPVGFWFHFTADELQDGFRHPEMFTQNLAGHKKFYDEFKPDFVKIMTDGFFAYPSTVFWNAKSARELRDVQSIGEHHPWIEKQVEFAKTLTGLFGSEVLLFYNIFAPATLFKFARAGKNPDTLLADFIAEDKGAVVHAFDVAARDLSVLAQRVIREGGADGIYYSAQQIDDKRISTETHAECIAPGDFTILGGANAEGGLNILHVCSYGNHHNDVSLFADYPAQVINWAAHLEGIPLGAGKKLFGGKPVIGGFDNTASGVLYKGNKEEIEAETARILRESGTRGVALGADCTLPRDIDLWHLEWVREKAKEFCDEQ
jgi:uroporphyrinogen decarboxylase